MSVEIPQVYLWRYGRNVHCTLRRSHRKEEIAIPQCTKKVVNEI